MAKQTIKISKSQWLAIGKKAGWMDTTKPKQEKKMCNRCKKKPAMDSYATCQECHETSLDEAEKFYADKNNSVQ